jgi:hypothetical protein
MFWFFFIIWLAYLVFNQYKGTYAIASVLPVRVRRRWIKHMYYIDYLNWDYYCSTLKSEFPYYKILTSEQQHEFVVRLIDVKNTMVFEGQQGFQISDYKLCLICASMVQLTFGFPAYRFNEFQKVNILPEPFYSAYLDQMVKGLTVGSGFIYLSWNYFHEGYKDYKSKTNLGLHEFAHALIMQRPNLMYEDNLNILKRHYHGLKKIREGQTWPLDLIRDYAFTNIHEFWAVLIEVFFEQPIALKAAHFHLYRFISQVLRQDMAKTLMQYQQRAKPNSQG